MNNTMFNHSSQCIHKQLIQPEKQDIFSNLDKTGYVIIFVAFLLGFFYG